MSSPTQPPAIPVPGSPDFWNKFGESAASIALTIGVEAAMIFAQAFANSVVNKTAK